MSHQLLREGRPYNIRRTGPGKYTLTVDLPTDARGMTARECPDAACSPGAFKVKDGTGITGGQKEAFCPYCGQAAEPDDFHTKEQVRYAHDIASDEAEQGMERMLTAALRLGPGGKRKLGGGLFPVELSMKRTHRPPVRRPREVQLRRDVTCPWCTLEHAVYGMAVWCPDCGEDIFVVHVEAESQVVRRMLTDVQRRSDDLGPRVAARDIENSLEDVVSIYEAALKAMVQRRLRADGKSAEDVAAAMKKIRNRCQSFDGSATVLSELFGVDLSAALEPTEIDRFARTLQKRHPITHNLGTIDRKYLEAVRTDEVEGRDISLDEQEVVGSLDTSLVIVRYIHTALFPK